MVKKKKKNNRSLWISGICAIVILLIALFFTISYSEKVNFKVITNSCHQEKISNNYNFPGDFEIISCPDVFILTDCYDSKGNKIIGEQCEKQRVFCWELKNKSLVDSIFVEETVGENYPVTTFTMYDLSFVPDPSYYERDAIKLKKDESTKKVCENIEVQGVILSGERVENNVTKEEQEEIMERGETQTLKEWCNTSGGNYYQENERMICTYNYSDFYPKEELSIGWLDENCLAFTGINQDGEEIFKKTEFPLRISEDLVIEGTFKYKCQDYYVEVLK